MPPKVEKLRVLNINLSPDSEAGWHTLHYGEFRSYYIVWLEPGENRVVISTHPLKRS